MFDVMCSIYLRLTIVRNVLMRFVKTTRESRVRYEVLSEITFSSLHFNLMLVSLSDLSLELRQKFLSYRMQINISKFPT